MSTYQDASRLKSLLRSIVKEEIENNQTIKSCIKAQKAVVWETPNITTKTIKVKFLPDIMSESEPLELPYNAQLESYLTSATVKQTAVSVWYNQSINNGIVYESGDWSI